MMFKSLIFAIVVAAGVTGQLKAQNTIALTSKIDSLVENFDVSEAAVSEDGAFTVIHSILERGYVYKVTSPQKGISIMQLALVTNWDLEQTTHHFGELSRHRFEISEGGNVVLTYDLYTDSKIRWLETRHGKFSDIPNDVAVELMLSLTYICD